MNVLFINSQQMVTVIYRSRYHDLTKWILFCKRSWKKWSIWRFCGVKMFFFGNKYLILGVIS